MLAGDGDAPGAFDEAVLGIGDGADGEAGAADEPACGAALGIGAAVAGALGPTDAPPAQLERAKLQKLSNSMRVFNTTNEKKKRAAASAHGNALDGLRYGIRSHDAIRAFHIRKCKRRSHSAGNVRERAKQPEMIFEAAPEKRVR